MTKDEKINEFNPSSPALEKTLFGLPFTISEANTVVIPVAWDGSVSAKSRTALAPQAILEASGQVDLYDFHVADAWKYGIAMDDILPWKIIFISTGLLY